MSDNRLEYAMAKVALNCCQRAIVEMTSAQSSIISIAGEQRKAVADLDAALLSARRALNDVQAVIRQLERVK